MKDNRNHEKWEPGPDRRLATRRERVIDSLLSIGDVLIAAAGGSAAATTVFWLCAYAVPAAIASTVGLADNGAPEGNHTESSASAISTPTETFLHTTQLLVAIAFAAVLGVYVTIRIARKQPLRGSPTRPVK